MFAGPVHGRPAPVVRHVDIGSVLDEQAGHREIVLLACAVQRREAVVIASVDLDAVPNKRCRMVRTGVVRWARPAHFPIVISTEAKSSSVLLSTIVISLLIN